MNDGTKLQAGEYYDLEEGTTYFRAGSEPRAIDIHVDVDSGGQILAVHVLLATPKGKALAEAYTARGKP